MTTNATWTRRQFWHQLHFDGSRWWISLSHWGLFDFEPMNAHADDRSDGR